MEEEYWHSNGDNSNYGNGDNSNHGYGDNSNHGDQYHEEDDVMAVLSYCVLPVIAQVTAVFMKIYGLSAIVSLSTQLQSDTLTLTLDALLGVLCAVLFYELSTLYIVLLVLLSYLVLVLSAATGKCGAAVLLVNLAFVFLCELLLVEAAQWHQIRGTVILLMMKTTSVGFDIDGGVITPPDTLLFAGYALSPVSLVFGPFITLPEYRRSKRAIFNRSTFYSICSALSLAYFSVLVSTCLLPSIAESFTEGLLGAYFAAQSFRTSHYFVCYTSQVSALIGGFQQSEKYSVVLPSKVELPQSMATVAVGWNLPMHYWLKTYVYKKSRSYGVFVAAFMTYGASSVLHGLNFQLPAVLFSIFIFSYVESIFRDELAAFVNSCVRVHACSPKCGYTSPVLSKKLLKTPPKCGHTNKVFVLPIKAFFVVVNMLQLAYLGVMFDTDPSQIEGYSWRNTLSKWQLLHWYGHVLCGAGLVATFLLRGANRVRGRKNK